MAMEASNLARLVSYKANFTPEKVMKAQRRSRGIALLFL
jgi:hypothetical protein